MKSNVRKLLYVVLAISCLGFAAFIVVNGKEKTSLPSLKERQGPLANAPDWFITQQTVGKLLAELKKNPDDTKNLLLLAKEFLKEGRASGNFSYYNKAALDLTNLALAKEPLNLDAICYKSMIFLSQHRFAEGKEMAMKGLKLNPYNSFIYGLLVDANVELGDYDEAVKMCDKMNSIRPDIRSYSRVSYLREIYGDLPAAVEAMKMAVAAGYPGNEDTEWARVVLAQLYEDSNQLDLAQEQYHLALYERPNYPFALAGLGRLARYRKDYPTAIKYFESARDIISDASFFEELIDLYRLNNQPEKAEECARITLNALLADNISAAKNKDNGHYSDLELAKLYLQLDQPAKAVEHAQIEHQRRPENIDANETLAWALYKQGQAAKAADFVKTVFKTNSQNPERLVKMGLVMLANGQKTAGKAMIEKGLALKPYMDEALVKEALSKTGTDHDTD